MRFRKLQRSRQEPRGALRCVALIVLACLAPCARVVCAADEYPPAVADRSPGDFGNLHLFRFEFDNDAFLGKDSAFTAGLSFQVHSPLHDTWGPRTAKWIGRIPGPRVSPRA